MSERRAIVAVLASSVAVSACQRFDETQTPEAAFATAVDRGPEPLPEPTTDKGRYVALEDLLGRDLAQLPPEACGPDVAFEPVAATGPEASVARSSSRCLTFRGPHDAVDEHVSDLETWVAGGTALTVVTEAEAIVFAIAMKAYPDRSVADRVFDALTSRIDAWGCKAREEAEGALGVTDCALGPDFAIAQRMSSPAPGGGSGQIHQVFFQVGRDRATAEAVMPLLTPSAP